MIKKDKKGLVKLPAKASVWYLAVSLISKGIGVITTPLFTRLLDGDAYGQFALYMTLLGIGSVVCSAFNSGSGLYRGLRKNEKKKQEYVKATLVVSIAVSLLLCLLLFAFSPFFELKKVYFIPLSLQLLCDGITAVLLSSERYYYKYKTIAAVSIASAVLPPLISIFILMNGGAGYSVRIYSLLFVSIFVAIFSLIRILRKTGENNIKPIGSLVREAIIFTLPMLPHSVSSALTAQADKLIISSLLGATALGKYSVVFSLGIALQFIINAVGSALSPWIIRRLEAGEGKKIAELATPMALGYSALSLCLIAVAPEALAILAPPEFYEAFPALLPIALSTPFFFISTVATVGIVHSGRTGYSLIVSAASALACVILNYTLIGKFGYLGAGLAFLICQALGAILSVGLLSRTDDKKMIDDKKTFLLIFISMPLGALTYMLRESILGRVIVLIIPALMLLYCLNKARGLVVEKRLKNAS